MIIFGRVKPEFVRQVLGQPEPEPEPVTAELDRQREALGTLTSDNLLEHQRIDHQIRERAAELRRAGSSKRRSGKAAR